MCLFTVKLNIKLLNYQTIKFSFKGLSNRYMKVGLSNKYMKVFVRKTTSNCREFTSKYLQVFIMSHYTTKFSLEYFLYLIEVSVVFIETLLCLV